jgi:hypothetical protein
MPMPESEYDEENEDAAQYVNELVDKNDSQVSIVTVD